MSKLEKVEKAIEKGKEAALIKLAQDKDEEVRLAAIAGMGKIGKDDSFNFIVPDMLTNDDPRCAPPPQRPWETWTTNTPAPISATTWSGRRTPPLSPP